MNQERTMSFQMGKVIEGASLEKISGGSIDFNTPNMTYWHDDKGNHISIDK